jgi:hypothetical protein
MLFQLMAVRGISIKMKGQGPITILESIKFQMGNSKSIEKYC